MALHFRKEEEAAGPGEAESQRMTAAPGDKMFGPGSGTLQKGHITGEHWERQGLSLNAFTVVVLWF